MNFAHLDAGFRTSSHSKNGQIDPQSRSLSRVRLSLQQDQRKPFQTWKKVRKGLDEQTLPKRKSSTWNKWLKF